MSIFEENSMVIPRSTIKDPLIVAALDRGCSLTKIVYLSDENDTQFRLHMALATNDQFIGALEWLKKTLQSLNRCDPNQHKIRTTGVGGDKYREQIQEITGLKSEFVDEFVSQGSGAQFFVSNFEDADFCFPKIELEMPNRGPPPAWMLEAIKKSASQYQDLQGKRFPVIFAFCGSAFGMNKLNEDGELVIAGATMAGGKSFMGLSQMLLGTNNYDEIMEMASKGKRTVLDTTAGEVMNQGDTAQYRFFPPETPLFPFGKLSDNTDIQEGLSKNDIAASLVSLYTSSFFPVLQGCAKNFRLKKIYLGGHFFKSEVARRALTVNSMMVGGFGTLELNFVNNGHTGALGAMITPPEVSAKQRENVKLS